MTLNTMAPGAQTRFMKVLARRGIDPNKKCKEDYDHGKHRPDRDPSPEQIEAVKDRPCWECARDDGRIKRARWRTERVGNRIVTYEDPKHGKAMARGEGHMTHDHQPPIGVAWHMGGCHMDLEDFKKYFERASVVVPHCEAHYRSQGTPAGIQAKAIEAAK